MSQTPIIETITSRDGSQLSSRCWRHAAPMGTVVIAHGHGEHSGCYDEFARTVWADLPLDVVAIDFRGHGLSTGRRGVIRRYTDLLDDLESFVAAVQSNPAYPNQPVFVFGHSNGGLAAIRLVETRSIPIAGLILSNPSLQLIAEAPVWKRLAGQILLHVAPWITFDTGISNDQLTQAVDEVALLADDPLRHHRISAPTYFGMVAHGPPAIAEADQITTPTYLILGGTDPITAPAAGQRFFDRLGATDKTLQIYPSMLHEPIHEVDRVAVIAAVVRWLGDRITPSTRPLAHPNAAPIDRS